jgi:hypothetical protein
MKDNTINYSPTISNVRSNNNTNTIDMNHHINNNNNIETDSVNSSNECPKCKKRFSSSQSLKTHLLTTLKCLKEKNEISNKCEYCDKQFSSKQMFIYHDNVCVHKKLAILTNTYENKIKQLEEQLSSMKEKSV